MPEILNNISKLEPAYFSGTDFKLIMDIDTFSTNGFQYQIVVTFHVRIDIGNVKDVEITS